MSLSKFKPKFNRDQPQISPDQTTGDQNQTGLKRIALGFGGFVLLMLILQFAGGGTKTSGSSSVTPGDKKARLNPTMTENSTVDVYEEALKQAVEAENKEISATTRFEWEEISNKYKRAYLLLNSVDKNNPRYAEAQEKIDFYKQRAENSRQKSLLIKENR